MKVEFGDGHGTGRILVEKSLAGKRGASRVKFIRCHFLLVLFLECSSI